MVVQSYVYDNETGLYYLQSRYYNPEWGRFINADALVSTGQGLLGNNMFVYCGNNPVNRTDFSGNDWYHWAAAAAVVAVAAVAIVATAGSAAGAALAITAVAHGVATSSTAITVTAGVFVGSSLALAGSALYAALTSESIDEFASCGEGALQNTIAGGIGGGIDAYCMYRAQHTYPQIPQDAYGTLAYIDDHNGVPPKGFRGGKTFTNDGRNERQFLPGSGAPYREYNIYPKISGVPRGTERLVLGSDGSAWYTNNHYYTFIQLR